MHRLPAVVMLFALVAVVLVPDGTALATGPDGTDGATSATVADDVVTTEAVPETVGAEIEGFAGGEPADEAARGTGLSAMAADGSSVDGHDHGDLHPDLLESEPMEAPIPFSLIGFEIPVGDEVSFRTSVDGTTWTAWEHVHPMDEAPDGTEVATDAHGRVLSAPAWVKEARFVQIRSLDPAGVKAHLIDSMGNADPADPDALTPEEALADRGVVEDEGATSADPAIGAPTGASAFAAAGVADSTGALQATPPDTVPGAAQETAREETAGEATAATPGTFTSAATAPPIVTRAQWGADESVTRNAGVASDITHAVVHHTASTNNYSAAEAPAQVRGFHRYHTLSHGWSDIGYNFLIDRYGRIYEGRRGSIDRAVIGAHASGFNTASVGVSLIGNFDGASPTSAALTSLRRLLVWKLGQYGVDPTATLSITSGGSPKFPSGTVVRLPAISGHRDTGLTSCPGAALYAALGSLRTAVKSDMGQRSLPIDDYAQQCLPEGDPNAPNKVWRAKGNDRIATSVVALKWYWRSARTVIVASAENFPDALAASAIAAQHDAPLVLTGGDRLDPTIGPVLQDKGVTQAIVMGGTGTLGSAVESDLRARGVSVTRVAGANRWETAARAAVAAGAPSGEVALALGTASDPGRAWPDALSAGSLAATPERIPTLLTSPNHLPAETAQALRAVGARTVWILGGTGAISTGVEEAVESLGITVRRLEGRSRYATSVAAATEARKRFPSSRTPLVIASGGNYPDALAAAAVAAKRDAPLLLVPPCGLEQARETATYLGAAAGSYADGVIIGGTLAISERIRWQVGTALAAR